MSRQRIARLNPASTIFFECDIQQKLEKHLFNCATMVRNAARLTQTAEILDIPIISTTQVNFGPVSKEITDQQFAGRKVFEGKKQFSMLTDEVDAHFRSLNRNTVVLYGCEAHICMKQTALDLVARDIDVFVVVDACTSMQIQDRNVGIASMRDAGVNLTTFQSVLFDLLKGVDHPKFKSFLPILKNNPDMALPLDLMS